MTLAIVPLLLTILLGLLLAWPRHGTVPQQGAAVNTDSGRLAVVTGDGPSVVSEPKSNQPTREEAKRNREQPSASEQSAAKEDAEDPPADPSATKSPENADESQKRSADEPTPQKSASPASEDAPGQADPDVIVAGQGSATRGNAGAAKSAKPIAFNPPPVLFSNLEPVRSIALADDHRVLATGHRDGTVRIWSLGQKADEAGLIERDAAIPLAMAFAPGGQALAVLSANRVELFGLPDRRLLVTIESIAELTSLAFASDGQHLAVGEREGGITVRSLPNLSVVHRLPGYGGVLSLAWCEDRQQFAVSSTDNVVRFWSPRESTRQQPLVGHSDWVSAMVVVDASRTLLTGSWDMTLRAWNTDSLSPIGQFHGPASAIVAIAASSDGRLAAAGTQDGLVKVWDLSSGMEVGTFRGHGAAIAGLAFLTDRLVVSASQDGSAKIFDALLGGEVPPWEYAGKTADKKSAAGSSDAAAEYARLIEQAKRLVERKDYRSAVDLYSRASELRHDYAEPHLLRGDCYLALDNAQEAVASYRVAVQLQPKSGWNRYRLGAALAATEQHGPAIETLREACEFLPDLAQIRLLLASEFLNEQKYGEAVREYQETIRQMPKCHEGYHGLGLAHANLGDWNRAIEELTKAIEIKRDYAPAYSTLVGVLLTANPPRVTEAANWVGLARNLGIELSPEATRRFTEATSH